MTRLVHALFFMLVVPFICLVAPQVVDAQTARVLKASAFKYPNTAGILGSVEFMINPGGADKLDRYRIEVTRAVDQDGNPIRFIPGPKEFKVARGMGEIGIGASFSDETGKLRSFRELVAELIIYSPPRAPESIVRVERIAEKLGTTFQVPGIDTVTVQLLTVQAYLETLSANERRGIEPMVSQNERNGFAVKMQDPSGRIVSYRYDHASGSWGSGGFYGPLASRLFYSSKPLSPHASLTFFDYNPKAETRVSTSFTDIPLQVIEVGSR